MLSGSAKDMKENSDASKGSQDQQGAAASSNPVQPKEIPSTNWGVGLPQAVMQNTLFGYHSLQEAENFAKASAETAADYAAPLAIARLAAQLLDHVAKGKQAEAEKLLKDNPLLASHLLTTKAEVTDYSGRKFRNITAFQYALWALDRHMWQMLLKYMPSKKAAEQLQELERDGVEYEVPATKDQKAQTRHEKHFSFDELTAAYVNYIGIYNSWNNNQGATDAQVDQAWLQVGLAQRNVPAHVANEYCRSDRSLQPAPNTSLKFDEQVLPRVLDLHYPETSWFPLVLGSGLGFDFAVVRGGGGAYAPAAGWTGHAFVAQIDSAAITALKDVRTQEFVQLRQNLPDLTPVAETENDSVIKGPALKRS